jgi:hypothetical protein
MNGYSAEGSVVVGWFGSFILDDLVRVLFLEFFQS